jgi:tripartite-type tricarboxylate transporter receptor subunit TctC
MYAAADTTRRHDRRADSQERKLMSKATHAFALFFAALLTIPAAGEDACPTRPITLIVPFAAGGSSDVIARIVADQMSQTLGQRIVNENVAGAGGSIALARAARATPDGYTIAIGNAGTNAAAYTIYSDLKYTPDDFVPIGLVAKTSAILAIKKDFPAKTLGEFVDYAKKSPGKLSLGHAGVGSSNYIVCKAFIQAAGVDVTLVSYRGAAPALNDLIAG